jgi:hypothetical protein
MEDMFKEFDDELSLCKKEMKVFKKNLSQQLSATSTDCKLSIY